MINIFYFLGFVFIAERIKDLIFWKKGFSESIGVANKQMEDILCIKESYDNIKRKDLAELDEAQEKLEGLISENIDALHKMTKPSSVDNILMVVFFIWVFLGIILSDLRIFFSLQLLSTFSFGLLPLFFTDKKKHFYILSIVSDILIMSSIIYIYFFK